SGPKASAPADFRPGFPFLSPLSFSAAPAEVTAASSAARAHVVFRSMVDPLVVKQAPGRLVTQRPIFPLPAPDASKKPRRTGCVSCRVGAEPAALAAG